MFSQRKLSECGMKTTQAIGSDRTGAGLNQSTEQDFSLEIGHREGEAGEMGAA